jgi:hypothetical protein
MYLSITLIRLKSPKHIYELVTQANSMMKVLQDHNCKGVKTRGIWKNHYTMTLWDNEKDLFSFSKSETHKKSVKNAGKISREIKIIRLERDSFPKWKEAKILLEKAKIYKYK